MADGARELRLPPSHHASDDRLGEPGVQLVVPARLAIEDRRLAARIVGEREGELRRREMDVDVLAARDQRGRAPAGAEQVAGDGGGESARVGEDGDRSLAQDLVGIIAAQRSTDAHLVPGVGHSQAVGAEDVDPALLSERPDLARVVHRQLLGDDEDLVQLGVDANQLGHPVARGGRRQVDDAAVEAVPGFQPLADAVVDGNVAGGRGQRLAAPAGRSAEDDVAAGPGMAHGRDLARLGAEDVEDADPVVAGGHLRKRADADEVPELA